MSKRSLRMLALFTPLVLLAALFFVGPVAAEVLQQEPPGFELHGAVVDPAGNLMPGGEAWVNVRSLDWTYEDAVPIDENGEFWLMLPEGEYMVWAEFFDVYGPFTPSLPRHVFIDPQTYVGPILLDPPLMLTFPSVMGEVQVPDGSRFMDCLDVWLKDMDWNPVAQFWYCGFEEQPYKLGGVPAGEYLLVGEPDSATGFEASEPISVTIEPGSQYDPQATQYIDIVLNQGTPP